MEFRYPRIWATAIVLTATFMAQFDFFVVNVAAPSLRHTLHTGDVGLELIVGGYAFTYASGLVLGGRLGDMFGHRRMFILGMAGFTVASVLCAVSGNSAELVAARLGQGLAAAMLLPQVLAIIAATFEPVARTSAMAWYGVAGGAGAIAGQVLGGLLIDVDANGFGWRLIFWANVPIGVLGVIAAATLLPQAPATSRASRSSLDPLGALGLAMSIGLLLVPLVLGRTTGWPWWAWICLASAVPCGAATVAWERALLRRGRQPVLDLALLSVRSFRRGLLANSLFMAFFASYMFALALLLQSAMGLDPLQAGLAFAPAALTFSASALAAPALIRHWRFTMPGASLLTAAGLVVLGALVASDGTSVPKAVVIALAAVISLGNGVLLPSLVGAALIDIAGPSAGAAAGAVNTAQQFASAVGVAGIGTVYFAASTRAAPAHGMVWVATVCALLVLAVGCLQTDSIRSRRNATSGRALNTMANTIAAQGRK